MTERRQAILCVDDEAVILLAMRQELRRRFGNRYAIETALGAEEAKAVIADTEAEGGKIVLIICDWFMPGNGATDSSSALHAWRPGIKSILMTGQADDDATRKAKEEAGICACIQKPWRAEVLARAIEECLASSPRRT